MSFLFAHRRGYGVVPAAGRGTFPPSADGESPAEVQRKTSRPLGANTPAAVRAPHLAGAEKEPPRQGEPACGSSRPPLSRCKKSGKSRKNFPARKGSKNARSHAEKTAATIRSGAYEKYLHKKDGTLDLFTQACPLFVPLVENGRVHRGDVVIETVVKEYLTPLKDAGVDTLILGCTHYPLLEEVIGDFMGPDVTLIDSGAEAANLASTQFDPNEGTGTTQYFVSDDPQGFDQLAELFLQEKVDVGAELVDISRY